MSANLSKPTDLTRRDSAVSGRLFFLDLAAGRVMSANPDGSNLKVLVEEGRKLPDGLAVDAAAGHLYWTNMGNLKANDGSILRSDLDGEPHHHHRSAGWHVYSQADPDRQSEWQTLLVGP